MVSLVAPLRPQVGTVAPRYREIALFRKSDAVRFDIIPPNRVITIALGLGLLALIGYGVYQRDPATIAIVGALLVFFGLPAFLLFSLNRRARLRPPGERDDTADLG